MYYNMSEILKDGEIGSAKLKHFTIIPDNFRAVYRDGIDPGEYVKLVINGEIMMSNTRMEKETNQEFVDNAHGKVLIGGLGIGLILLPILVKPEVEEVTIIEYNKDVINLVEPQLRSYFNNKVKIINDSVFEYVPSQEFNTIYMDVWNFVNSNIYESEMEPLLEFYQDYIVPDDENAYLKCWCQENAMFNRRF